MLSQSLAMTFRVGILAFDAQGQGEQYGLRPL